MFIQNLHHPFFHHVTRMRAVQIHPHPGLLILETDTRPRSYALPPQGDCRPEARKQEHCRLHPQVGKRPRTSVRQQRQEQQQQDDISRYKPPHRSSLSNQPSSLPLFYPHFDGVLFLIQIQFANLITKACYPIFPIQTNRGPFMPSDLLQVRLRQGITFTFYEDQF